MGCNYTVQMQGIISEQWSIEKGQLINRGCYGTASPVPHEQESCRPSLNKILYFEMTNLNIIQLASNVYYAIKMQIENVQCCLNLLSGDIFRARGVNIIGHTSLL